MSKLEQLKKKKEELEKSDVIGFANIAKKTLIALVDIQIQEMSTKKSIEEIFEQMSDNPIFIETQSTIKYDPYPPPHLKFDTIPDDLDFSNVDPEKMFRSHKKQMDELVKENTYYMKQLSELSESYHKVFQHDLELQEEIKVLKSQVVARSDFVMKIMNDNTTLEKQNEEFRNKLFALEALEDQIKKFNQEGW